MAVVGTRVRAMSPVSGSVPNVSSAGSTGLPPAVTAWSGRLPSARTMRAVMVVGASAPVTATGVVVIRLAGTVMRQADSRR